MASTGTLDTRPSVKDQPKEVGPELVTSLDVSGFETTQSVSCLSTHIHSLQRRYNFECQNGTAPVGRLLASSILEQLDIDITKKPEGIPEVCNRNDLDWYHTQPDNLKVFTYVNEQIAGNMECNLSKEPLVNLEEVANQRGVKIQISPVEKRFNGAIYLRESVAEAVLEAAQLILKETDGKITLKIYDGYRALEDQEAMFQMYYEKFAAAMNGATHQEIWNSVTQVVADPKLIPPHSTGGALDLTLINADTLEELDMGSGVNELNDKAATWSKGLTAEQEYNRLLLVGTMMNVGFFNLPTEFWHYSIGDPYHALYQGDQTAKYATIKSLNDHHVICSKFKQPKLKVDNEN